MHARPFPSLQHQPQPHFTPIPINSNPPSTASLFISVSPDDVHDPLAMRLSFPSRGVGTFPDNATGMLGVLRPETQTAEEHAAAVAAFKEEEATFPLDEAGQQRLASANPVATMQNYRVCT